MSLNQRCADALEEMRKKTPLCHCITNYVSMDIMANTLLAIGASPIMAHEVDEVEDMVSICGATLVNIGTLSQRWIEAMVKAAKKADAIGKCWVLDPVGAGATPLRMNTCKELLKYHPTVIRGNASEIFALAGIANGSRGVDSTDSSSAAINAGKALAKEYHCVVGITGEVDYVTDGDRVIEIHNGVEMCTLITAAGCSLTSIICAFLAIGIPPMEATAFTLACFGVASEMAAEKAKGPGSLRVMELMDALYLMKKEDIIARARFA
ncbi:hypothetical protein WA577_003752 [Blastocystis sp. JDR]